jgi:hypothetical protein
MFVALFLLSTIDQAIAISGAGGIALTYNPSARSAGMGKTGAAVFWGDGPNYWANPALLGYHRGINFEHTGYELATGLADDIFLEADRLTLGFYGVGLSFAGKPFSLLPGYKLDLGEQVVTDETGQVGETFESWMEVKSLSLGVNIAEVLGSETSASSGGVPGLGRFYNGAIGFSYKDYEDRLAPDSVLQDCCGSRGEASTYDYGFLVILSPYNSVDFPNSQSGLDQNLDTICGGIRFDFTYGYSVLNAKEEWIEHADSDSRDPMPKMYRSEWAVHAVTGLPGSFRDALYQSGRGWLAESLSPLVSIGYSSGSMVPGISWDTQRQDYVFEKDETEKEEFSGWELSFANIFFLRRGHHKSDAKDIDDDTTGWGIGIHLGKGAGFRYDQGKVPQATGLPDLTYKSWIVFFNVTKLKAIWD